jgi:hypothetical protein
MDISFTMKVLKLDSQILEFWMFDSLWSLQYVESLHAFLEHIFKKMGSTEIVMSSVRPSVRYFSAGIAPRELKFWT